ncbi:MAG: OmpA family protein [Flavobacteriales bacterium]|nr:OmpA family protein [Flavobacteriales bacterium]
MGDDGAWSKPEKLGPNVNTPMQEESVQIHPDGRTLYFSSNGHPSFGGLDIFVSRMQDDGTWGKALNLGYPINTGADENSLLVSADGRVAYFASDRSGGLGDLDLYSFELYAEARPQPVTYIRGHVTDKTNGSPVEADVELFDLSTGKLATAAYSDPKTGEFLVCLPSGRSYALNAGAEGYLFFSENYDVAAGTAKEPVTLEVPLSPLTRGSVIALRNIFFNTASYDLLPASNAELDKLVKLLKANPTLRIELGGHTDNVGNDAANQKLSEQRANTVRDFVVKQGIDGARITAKGYGETKPVATNDTEEGRAQNRRTEVRVLRINPRQLPRPLARRFDGAFQHVLQFALRHHLEGRFGGAAFAHHGLDQLFGRAVGVLHQVEAAEHGLLHERAGHMWLQAEAHSGFDHHAHDLEEVGGAAAAERGHGIEQGFIGQVHGATGAVEQLLHHQCLPHAQLGAGGVGSDAHADLCGGVGHGTHHGLMPKVLAQSL